jgi:hypothetical protein
MMSILLVIGLGYSLLSFGEQRAGDSMRQSGGGAHWSL